MSGRISTDTTWTLAGSPYVVTATVQVYGTTTTPVTLTIEPGAIVKFASGAGLQIGSGTNQGALVARGTATDRIVFTRSAASGNWGSITYNDGTVDATSVIEYADLPYSSGVSITSASPVFRNSTMTDMNGYLSFSSANPTLDNVAITSNNTSYGISLSSSSPIITGGSLTVSGTGAHGISGTGSPSISNYAVSIVNSAGKYGLYLTSTSSTLLVTNSTIGNSLYISATGVTPTISGNTFTNADNSPPHAGANIIGQILSGNTCTGLSAAGKIEVVTETITQNGLWQKQLAPYVVTSTVTVAKDATNAATLTIGAGTEVRFASGAGLQIGNGPYKGALAAQGTAEFPVLFTRSGSSGTWGTITFQDATVDATTILEHADIRYSTGVYVTSSSPILNNCNIQEVTGTYGLYLSAGNPVLNGGSLSNTSANGHGIYGTGSPVISNYTVSIVDAVGKYGLYLTGTSSTLSVTNSTIGNSLYISATGVTPTISGNTFTNADNSPPHAGANIIGQILSGNTCTGLSAAGKIEVVTETITQNGLWQKQLAPYVVTSTVAVAKDATNAATLTIGAGTEVRFTSGAGLQICNGPYKGILSVQGTAAAPVVFTANQATPTAGSWSGVTLSCAAASASLIEYAVIEYAGSGGSYSSANLSLSSASPTIRHCIVRNSAGSGIYMSSANATPQVLDSEITGNKWGVYASASNPRIGNNRISGNATAGVWNATSSIDIDARGNWWGAESGPTHAGNPGGSGNLVTDHVVYDPRLIQSPNTFLSIADPAVQPAVLNPSGGSVTFTANLSAVADWAVIVADGAGTTVKTMTGNGAAIARQWTGDSDQGETVSNGTYSYNITASNAAGTAAPVKGTLGVSGQVTAILTAPTDNQMFPSGPSIDITGTASAISNFKNYVLDYGLGENPVSWTTLKTSTTPLSNGLLYAWNTSSLTGSSYTLRLTVSDNLGNTAVIRTRVRFLSIANAAGSQGYISPNGDGIKDATTVSATFSQASDWIVTVKNGAGTPVRTYSGSGTSLAQIWDGKDGFGSAVMDGLYTWKIDATSHETGVQAVMKTGTVTVDATPPSAQVTAPVSSATVFNTFQIIGTASDANLDYYRVEYEPVGGVVATLTQSTTSVNAGTLATWATNDGGSTVLFPNGEYMLWLTVVDKAGNSASAICLVTIDNLLVTNVSSSSHLLDAYQSQSATIEFSANAPTTATLKIVPELLGAGGTPVYQTSQICPTGGTYTFTWNGRNSADNVVPDEAYLYVIEVSDGIRTNIYAPPRPTGTGSVTCSQESAYYPYKNDPLTIAYVPAQPSRVNINIAWGAQNFKVMDAKPHSAGSHTFDWDGRNPVGKILDGGGKAYCSVASLLAENHIITFGYAPGILSVTTDPYRFGLSFGQFTRINYTLAADAVVTVRLIPPSGNAQTLLSGQTQSAGSHEVVWDAVSTGDASEKAFDVSVEGDYVVEVTAANPTTGAIVVRKGCLVVDR